MVVDWGKCPPMSLPSPWLAASNISQFFCKTKTRNSWKLNIFVSFTLHFWWKCRWKRKREKQIVFAGGWMGVNLAPWTKCFFCFFHFLFWNLSLIHLHHDRGKSVWGQSQLTVDIISDHIRILSRCKKRPFLIHLARWTVCGATGSQCFLTLFSPTFQIFYTNISAI